MSVAGIAGLRTISITCAVNAQAVRVPVKTPIKGLVSKNWASFFSADNVKCPERSSGAQEACQ